MSCAFFPSSHRPLTAPSPPPLTPVAVIPVSPAVVTLLDGLGAMLHISVRVMEFTTDKVKRQLARTLFLLLPGDHYSSLRF